MDLKAQTFTLEGVAASLLLLLATYTIFQSTIVIAPSWSEFENVQLKQLGYDILRILDNPSGGNLSLKGMVETLSCDNNINTCVAPEEFNSNLSFILSSLPAYGKLEILCVSSNGTKNEIKVLNIEHFNKTPTPNAVRVSRFILVDNPPTLCHGAIVAEVRLTLWR